MKNDQLYDACIVGGGLAGLSLSILLAKKGYNIALFEKEQYPFQRVCGEYISMESWQFLIDIGLPLDAMDLPRITQLEVSSPDGYLLKTKLDLGGFGISRYKIDESLSIIARNSGVHLFDNTKVNNIFFENNQFVTKTVNQSIHSKIAVAAYGKRSNLDIKWSREFIKKRHSKLNNYIGVKYHMQTNLPANKISLHNFKNGYCGVSKIEGDKYCLCYLTTAENLKLSGNSIENMEKDVLALNPHIKHLFMNCKRGDPVTISQISFDKKNLIENHIIMIGDSAGMITPLCGNGMSMAFRSAQIIYKLIDKYLREEISFPELEMMYRKEWKNEFSNRLRTGRLVQSIFGKEWATNIFIYLMNRLPLLTNMIIKSTHGKPF